MQRSFIICLFVGILTLSCSSNPEITLRISNPMDQMRSDAIVLLSRGEISGWTTIPENQLPVLKDSQGNFIPCQADDVDGDGYWDELFALTDLEADGSQSILLSFISPDEYPVFPARTNLHLGDAKDNYQKLERADRLEGVSFHNYSGRTGKAFQMEGPAWENDLVGFRNYLDQRNGLDIFGKTTREMVLDSVGIEGGPSYHEPDWWGSDVLKVGTSLGAGGIGYLYKDSIYRVGDNGSGTYEVMFRGTQRSRFKLNYTNWMLENEVLNVNHQVEIAAGRRYYQGLVTYSGTEESFSLVVGIVNMKSDQLHVLKLNDHYTALYTLDHQAEDSTMLAMALMVPSSYLKLTGETKDMGEGVTQTYYALLDASPGDPVPYRFYSLWEQEDQKWSSSMEIENFLKTEAERWTQSVVYPGQHH